jgi:hypothetical protein
LVEILHTAILPNILFIDLLLLLPPPPLLLLVILFMVCSWSPALSAEGVERPLSRESRKFLLFSLYSLGTVGGIHLSLSIRDDGDVFGRLEAIVCRLEHSSLDLFYISITDIGRLHEY